MSNIGFFWDESSIKRVLLGIITDNPSLSANEYDRIKDDKPARSTIGRVSGIQSWPDQKKWILGQIEAGKQPKKATEVPETEIVQEFTQSSGVITTKSLNIKTVEDALKVAQVDTSQWEVDRFIINSWEVTLSAFKSSRNEDTTYTNWQVKVWLKRKGFDPVAFSQEIIDLMANHAPAYDYTPPVLLIPDHEKVMQELDFMDLHYGKRAWGEETGSDYDKDIAQSRVMEALDDLLAKSSAFKPELFLLPIGNDLMHVDTLENTTTRGTRQDVDDRAHMIFREVLELCVTMIDKLLSMAPVEVKIIPGNHDQLSTFHLGTALSAWYRNCQHVCVDNQPMLRKYMEYGKNLIGFVHGSKDDPKLDKLPLIMAQEQKEAWGRTIFREWHTGDKHKRKKVSFLSADTHNGVHVKILPSLSGVDFWHYQHGFTCGETMAETYLWDYDNGCVGNFHSFSKRRV